MQFEDCALKTNVFLPAHPQKLYALEKGLGPILIHKIIRLSLTQCQKQLSTPLRHGDLLREKDGAIEFWRLKGLPSERFCALSLNIGLMNSGRAQWQKAEETIVPIHQD